MVVNITPFGRSDLPQAAGRLPLRYVSVRVPRMTPFAIAAVTLALALSATPARAEQSITLNVINADAWVKGLPLSGRELTRSGDGRKKQRWKILGVELSNFEIIGNTQADADLVGWNCVEFDVKGNSLSPLRDKSFCRRFLASVLNRFAPEPESVAQDLLSRSAKAAPASATRLFGDLLVETDGEFYFVRRKSRMVK